MRPGILTGKQYKAINFSQHTQNPVGPRFENAVFLILRKPENLIGPIFP